MQVRRLALAASLLMLGACAPQPSRTTTTSTNTRVISSSELAAGTQTNLYDFVSATRPRWLQPRTAGGHIPQGRGMGEPTASVTIYVNNVKMGGTEVLRGYSRDAVASMRYYDMAEAQQRFNDRTLGAVIQLIMK